MRTNKKVEYQAIFQVIIKQWNFVTKRQILIHQLHIQFLTKIKEQMYYFRKPFVWNGSISGISVQFFVLATRELSNFVKLWHHSMFTYQLAYLWEYVPPETEQTNTLYWSTRVFPVCLIDTCLHTISVSQNHKVAVAGQQSWRSASTISAWSWVAQGHLQAGLNISKEWRLYNIFRQPGPVLTTLTIKK